jgi:hypothetical protein
MNPIITGSEIGLGITRNNVVVDWGELNPHPSGDITRNYLFQKSLHALVVAGPLGFG